MLVLHFAVERSQLVLHRLVLLFADLFVRRLLVTVPCSREEADALEPVFIGLQDSGDDLSLAVRIELCGTTDLVVRPVALHLGRKIHLRQGHFRLPASTFTIMATRSAERILPH